MIRNFRHHLFFASVAAIVFAFQTTVQATWIADEDLRPDLAAPSPKDSQISESEFQKLINSVQSEYASTVTKLGGKLEINGDWKGEKPNAGAAQTMGKWQVKITGGLARRPELSPDAFTLILCHELGHHLGGFVIAPQQTPFEKPWAANEGQADYFSTHVCSHRMWSADTQKNAGFRNTVKPAARRLCDSVWVDAEEQNLCYRVLTAVESMTNTMAALTGKPVPQFDTPDLSVVEKTNHAHPAPQCRMDTTAQAALCTAFFDSGIIPGKGVPQGGDSIEAERESASFSCSQYSGYSIGLRPNCWFKSRL